MSSGVHCDPVLVLQRTGLLSIMILLERVLTAWTKFPARFKRIAGSVKAGMRNPQNVESEAQSCLHCHTTADEESVNIGGHYAGILKFEFISRWQGLFRTTF